MTRSEFFSSGLANWVSVVFWLAVAALLVGLYRRAGLWWQGRHTPVPWGQLLRAPKRYFHDLHEVVAREPQMARAHVLAGGGVVLSVLLVALNYGLRIGWRGLDLLLLVSGSMVLAGAWWLYRRRHGGARPSRLSGGVWQRLPKSLLAFGVAVVGIGVLSWLGWAGVTLVALLVALALLAGVAELALGIGMGGPMKHAVAGLLNLAFHPRPERFADQAGVAVRAASALRVADTAAGDWGVAKPADFAWNRLLNFDACVQCGKCEEACPAFAAGQPLNPKKLVQDLVTGMAGQSDVLYSGSPYPGQPVGQHRGRADEAIVPQLISAQTLWSCTTCRACVQACPMLVEHVDAVVDMRRHLSMVVGEVPNKGSEVLQQLRETDTQGGFDLGKRHHWAVDLNVAVLAPQAEADCLLLVGEGGFDMRYQRTLRALVKSLQQAGVVVSVLGAAETDCGDVARRLGDEVTFTRLAHQLMDTLGQYRFKRLVTADPHLYHCLKNEYPTLRAGFGQGFALYHHSQLLSELLLSGSLKATAPLASEQAITYHDPCYLGRYNQEFAAPRQALKQIGIQVLEMGRSQNQARCCGGGGGAPYTDIPGKTRIPDMRMQDVLDTGATRVAVACPQCTAMLEGVSGARAEVVDIAELVAQAVGVRV